MPIYQNGNIPTLKDLLKGRLSGMSIYKTPTQSQGGLNEKYRVIKERQYQLLQAVIDDDSETVKTLLDKDPELLLEPIKEGLTIQSQYTWQTFYAEHHLVMALARNQDKMVEILLPYFDKLENGREEAQLQWQQAEKIKQEQPKITVDDFCQLIDTIIKRTPAEVEQALEEFRHIVLPAEAVRLEDYYDVEQLLIAALTAYNKRFDDFQYWPRRDTYAVKGYGFSQSLLPPRDAKKLYDLKDGLKFYGGANFYRDSYMSEAGVGFNYFATAGGGAWRLGRVRAAGACARLRWASLEKSCSAKTADLGKLRQQLFQPPGPQHVPSPVSCSIS